MRVGSLIQLKPEWEERYIILHKHAFPGVLDRIRQSHIRNYSIFHHEGMLFSYWEYRGQDYDADMAAIRQDQITQDWWKLTDPMQEPLVPRKAGERWATMEEIFHWHENTREDRKVTRMALTAKISAGSEDTNIPSLKIAYQILAEKADLKDIQSFSVFHKEGCLYWYTEYAPKHENEAEQYFPTSLKVEDELDWAPMIQVFHLG